MGPTDSARSMLDLFARKAYYTAGLVGGVFALLIGPSHGSWRRSRRRSLARAREMLVERTGDFHAFRSALFGATKGDVLDALGSPTAAAVGLGSASRSSAAIAPRAAAYQQADAWYYPFDPDRQAAVALHFHHGRVVRVEFIGGLAP